MTWSRTATNLNDQEALELAMSQARQDIATAEQLDSMLAGTRDSDGKGWACKPRPWQEVAEFAAYHCQTRSMRLRPWDTPPCHANEDGSSPAASFLRKMLAAGVSRWHPDPLAALKEVQPMKAVEQ